ncbi:MAG: hypothetical protein SNJ55_09050 [Chloroherpetonaceae bacterium]
MKELQLYLTTKHAWRDHRFEAETRYAPSVYVAKLSLHLPTAMDDEEKENLAQSLLRILEEKLKSDFKRYLEDTEERSGFLETSVLMRLSEKLAREVERVAKRHNAQWETAID